MFSDPVGATREDDHPLESPRLTLGLDATGKLLVVCYIRRGSKVRILSARKTRIIIRLDDSILERFKAQVHAAGGGNYQSLINAALAEQIRRRKEPLEDILGRVIREKLPGAIAKGRPAGLHARGV